MQNIFFYEDINFPKNFTKFLQSRQQDNSEIVGLVRKVIDDVRAKKDSAVIKYTQKFYNINLERL